jgi:hypothetical protein
VGIGWRDAVRRVRSIQKKASRTIGMPFQFYLSVIEDMRGVLVFLMGVPRLTLTTALWLPPRYKPEVSLPRKQ